MLKNKILTLGLLGSCFGMFRSTECSAALNEKVSVHEFIKQTGYTDYYLGLNRLLRECYYLEPLTKADSKYIRRLIDLCGDREHSFEDLRKIIEQREVDLKARKLKYLEDVFCCDSKSEKSKIFDKIFVSKFSEFLDIYNTNNTLSLLIDVIAKHILNLCYGRTPKALDDEHKLHHNLQEAIFNFQKGQFNLNINLVNKVSKEFERYAAHLSRCNLDIKKIILTLPPDSVLTNQIEISSFFDNFDQFNELISPEDPTRDFHLLSYLQHLLFSCVSLKERVGSKDINSIWRKTFLRFKLLYITYPDEISIDLIKLTVLRKKINEDPKLLSEFQSSNFLRSLETFTTVEKIPVSSQFLYYFVGDCSSFFSRNRESELNINFFKIMLEILNIIKYQYF